MNNQDITYLGGLLHDIGKFVYRALSTTGGKDHEDLGEEFAREYLIKKFDCFYNYDSQISNAIKRGNTFIREADHASAGERQDQASTQTRRALYSIFKYVNIGLDEPPKVVYYQKPTPLTHNLTEHPVRVDVEDDKWYPNKDEMIELHNQSLTQFKEELKQISDQGSTKHVRAAMSTLYSLLWKYTSTVSSASYKANPDLSLFDHSRMVAALSVCMMNAEDINQPVILLKGDISGIQKFIYSEIKETDGAAKKLRGRSFFVKLLADTLSNYIIRQYDLYDSNIVYNSGGGFEIIIPANQTNREKLIQIEKYINLSLFQMFGSKLQVVMAWGEYPIYKMFKNFDEIQQDLTKKLSLKKKQKSLSILEKIFPESIVDDENKRNWVDFEAIGTAIPHTEYLIEVISDNVNGIEDKSRIIDLTLFGQYWYLVDKNQGIEKAIAKINNNNPKFLTIYSIKDTEIGKLAKHTKYLENVPIALSFKFIATNAPTYKDIKNLFPIDKNTEQNPYELVQFNDLAKLNSENYPLLGILRMDVDNLGFIFKKGLSGETYSISRLASLSRQMDMFFTHDVDIIAREHKIYITYSGGDDLFAVGSWSNIIEFALNVRKMFANYTTNNGNITLSGGIAITKANYPIAKSAILSGEAEDKAKNDVLSKKQEDLYRKDKICLFDTILTWNELDEKIQFANDLNEAIKLNKDPSKGITNSFIYKLLTIVRQTIDKQGSLDMDKVYRFTAKMHYLFARREMSEANIEEDKNEIIKNIKRRLLQFFLKSEENKRRRWYITYPVIGNYIILKNRKPKEIDHIEIN